MTAYVCIQMYSGYDQITVLLATSDNILSDWSSQKFIGLEFAFDYYIKAPSKTFLISFLTKPHVIVERKVCCEDIDGGTIQIGFRASSVLAHFISKP